MESRTWQEALPSAWPENYIDINKAAYDALVDEYRHRRVSDYKKDLSLIAPFVKFVTTQCRGDNLRILDIGCGTGLNLSMFATEGFDVTGVDVSPLMIDAAREICPKASLIVGDFLTTPFREASFAGIFAKAIIHLFPMNDAVAFIEKCRHLLQPGGVIYLTTTIEDRFGEGLLEKHDYAGRICRYRKQWSEFELVTLVENARFVVTKTGYNQEVNRAKNWFNVWATVPS